jgi:hypothetical protein
MSKSLGRIDIMSRTTAVALIGILLLPMCLSLAQPDSDASLPACCRRDGKHHCAMLARYQRLKQDQSGQPAVRTSAGSCPYRSMLFSPAAPRAAGLPAFRDFHARLVSYPTIVLQAALKARISEARSHYKRGPPSFLV